ncbi:MAG: extracellular solute-binding protein, partial [Inquilinus sp.]|nr:extracellular solute-binding protein [Inquilinus sp.]
MKFRFLLAASAVALTAGTAQAATEIQWWHAMGGALGEKVDEIAAGFNATQSDFTVVPVFKGNYTETMTAAIAGFRTGQQPHIVQVFEVGTATMMAAEGAIYPVHQLMDDTGEAFDIDAFLPSVTGYYTTTDGDLLSMPFNSSTPVMYYNKEAFAAAGLDPDSPPKTWPEFAAALEKTQAAGTPCGFTTAWQSWVHVENFSAWHNVPIGTQANGFGGLDTEFMINSPAHAAHIGAMA